jgi:hypothetical protein
VKPGFKTARPHHTKARARHPAWAIDKIETWRREHKCSAQRITDELANIGFATNRLTVTRHLTRVGLSKRKFIDPGGDNNRTPGTTTARWPGHMVHLDVKKLGRVLATRVHRAAAR